MRKKFFKIGLIIVVLCAAVHVFALTFDRDRCDEIIRRPAGVIPVQTDIYKLRSKSCSIERSNMVFQSESLFYLLAEFECNSKKMVYAEPVGAGERNYYLFEKEDLFFFKN